LPNSKYRTREYLTEREVNKLIEAAKSNRWGQRDFTMVLNATPSYRRPSSRAYFATNNPVSNPAGDPLRRFD
jgi:hypothetical protein